MNSLTILDGGTGRELAKLARPFVNRNGQPCR